MSSDYSDTKRRQASAADKQYQARVQEALAVLKEDPKAASAAMAAFISEFETARAKDVAEPPPLPKDDNKKRAICLAGGGPAVGLHIGALEALKTRGLDFGKQRSVWALSCIGAWVGIVYNQAKDGEEIETTYNFFREVFRDDKSFESFPTNTIFAPDWAGCAEAAWNFMLEPKHYKNAILPRHMMESGLHTLSVLRDRKNWGRFNEGDFNRWTLNHILAVNPMVRFLTALLYKSEIDGSARLHYKDSKFLKDIKFKNLDGDGKPYIFHNAFNFKRKDVDLFANNSSKWGRKGHKALTAESVCACSALPFVEQTVSVDGEVYCEGALVDTLNFKHLLHDHHHPNPDPAKNDSLDEIWINRIVDVRQIRKPENMHDALANLCQMFAATVGEDDIKLFKHHVRENYRSKNKLKWEGTIVEIQVDDQIDFHWSHKNLDRGRANGAKAAADAYKLYSAYKDNPKTDGVLIIPDDLKDDEITRVGVPLPSRRQREAKYK